MSVTDRLVGFITEEAPSAIAVVGKWGQGKTYFWHQTAGQHAIAAQKTRPNYAYVSLFGINSLADLRIELAQKIRPVEHMKDDTFAALLGTSDQTLTERVKDQGWRKRLRQSATVRGKALADMATGAGVGVPHIGNLGPLYRGWAYSRVKDALICLDDLERRGAGLALKDVLGLVSQLVIERKCSVVVIFNDGAFDEGDKTIWEANREKVFLGEVIYTATPEVCAGYIFKPDPAEGTLHGFAKDAALDLRLTNVRIIERVKLACDQILPALNPDLLDATRRNIARCLALYIYMVAGQGEGAPPPYQGTKSSLMRTVERMYPRPEAAPPDPRQKGWDDLLGRYNFHFHGELDEALIDAVNQGFPDLKTITAAADAYDQSMRTQDLDEEFNRTWRLFHDTFADNGEEIIARMSDSFFRLITTTSPTNADSTIRLMRTLGDDELASRMIDEWIATRSTEERWKELSKRQVEMFNPIKDHAFADAIADAYAAWVKQTRPSFEELLDALRQNQYLQTEDMTILAETPVEDYVSYILQHPGEHLHQTITSVLELYEDDQDPNRAVARGRMRTALEQIAAASPLNKVRVKWKFEISPPDAN
ncbi:hypothetical protein [Luteibacter yeojuensis]|uniref:KAP NTPase domain-containing protein n=1 Tax=Luteibacter yeojuensis TaxID=345309 RepID=A0A0F3L169_9GAMM|nr:hypothetical protein [Luteibacter yeojuensis]KJV36972.1 hypothetical protein VI08_01905 [Luteibacter yeojuensis]